MATIGHALVGLTLGEFCPAKSRANKLQYVWFGLMVAAAFLVDFAEWVALFFVPPGHDKHFITHSPVMAGAIATFLVLITACITRMRSPWPYMLIAIAVMSHLPLDAQWGRAILADAYGFDEYAPSYPNSIIAEAWLFGLVLLVTTLIFTMRDARVPSKGRFTSFVLAILAIATAATRTLWIWLPIYTLALVHTCLIWRSRLSRKLLWGLVFLIPLLAVPISGAIAVFLTNQAIEMRTKGNDAKGALAFNEFIIRFPSRNSIVSNYIEISRCYESLNKPADAFAALNQAIKNVSDYSIHRPRFFLAMFHMNQRWKGTEYYRPDIALRILNGILNETDDPDEHRWANEAIAKLQRQESAN